MFALLIFGLIDVGDALIVYLLYLTLQFVVLFLESVDEFVGFIELPIQLLQNSLSLFDLLLHTLQSLAQFDMLLLHLGSSLLNPHTLPSLIIKASPYFIQLILLP